MMMPRRITACAGSLLVLALSGLVACSPSTPTPGWAFPRRGVLSELTGAVAMLGADGTAFADADRGSVWDVNAQIRIGDAGTARLNLVDGIYLRLGPNTLLINRSLPSEWQLDLERGVLWGILNSRTLTIRTPLGQVTAQGTVVATRYDGDDPATLADDVWSIQCLRASCQVKIDGQSILLGDLGKLTITDSGESVEQSTASRADVDDFIASNPEANRLLANQRAAAPAPSDTPPPVPQLTASKVAAVATSTAKAKSSESTRLALNATPATVTRTKTRTQTRTQTLTSTVTPTATATPTPTRTSTATARPTRVFLPTYTPTGMLAPTDASNPGSNPPGQPPPGPTQPPPPAPTEPPPRTAPPPKP